MCVCVYARMHVSHSCVHAPAHAEACSGVVAPLYPSVCPSDGAQAVRFAQVPLLPDPACPSLT